MGQFPSSIPPLLALIILLYQALFWADFELLTQLVSDWMVPFQMRGDFPRTQGHMDLSYMP